MFTAPLIRWIAPALLLFATGCATSKTITITTKPPDATIKIDGAAMGRGQVTHEFNFDRLETAHDVMVLRKGFRDEAIPIARDFNKSTLHVELKPLTRMVSISVTPSAMISIDGAPITPSPVDAITKELEFTVDQRDNWIVHTVTAERAGYAKAEKIVAFQDKEDSYSITLEPQKKNLNITTNPPGASVYLDGELLGTSPVTVADQRFPVDPNSDKPLPRKLRADKTGFDPIEREIGWDNGKTEYMIDLAPKAKMVRIITDPPGAVVTIDGRELEHDASGASLATLEFPPIDDKGELKTFDALVSKKTQDSEWVPTKLSIGWDEGKNDYTLTLPEVKTRPVPLMMPMARRTEGGWEILPERTTTIAMKDVTEGPNKEPPVQISKLPRGTQIDTIALSPNGAQILFTILSGSNKSDFRSQMMVVKSDGSEAADYLSDGQSLDVMPSFTPMGDEVVFSSNRAGTRMKIWSMSASGAPGIMQLTTGETNDLWPVVDSSTKARLFYQAHVDNRAEPRIFSTQRGTTNLTDLNQMGGMQPRVSPRALESRSAVENAVVFTISNEKTGKRDICSMSDKGGVVRNLTDTPDIDEFDPIFNKDGSKVAFVSDVGVDEDKHHNYDLWIMELAHPDKPVQATINGSYDDHPVWDLSGNYLYFRSNRGGEWAIWKFAVNQGQPPK